MWLAMKTRSVREDSPRARRSRSCDDGAAGSGSDIRAVTDEEVAHLWEHGWVKLRPADLAGSARAACWRGPRCTWDRAAISTPPASGTDTGNAVLERPPQRRRGRRSLRRGVLQRRRWAANAQRLMRRDVGVLQTANMLAVKIGTKQRLVGAPAPGRPCSTRTRWTCRSTATATSASGSRSTTSRATARSVDRRLSIARSRLSPTIFEFHRSELRTQRRQELLRPTARLRAGGGVVAERNDPRGEVGDAGVPVALQAAPGSPTRLRLPSCRRRPSRHRARAAVRSSVRSGRGRGPRWRRSRAASTSRLAHKRDRDARDDARCRPAGCAGGLRDARDHVLADRPLVGHPENRAGRVLAGDAQHHRRERGDQDRHRRGVDDVERAVHAVAVVLDVDRARTGERGVEHLQVVPHQRGRAFVGQPELVLRRSNGAKARARA